MPNGNGDDFYPEDDPQYYPDESTGEPTDADRTRAREAIEQGDPAPLTPEQHLAYQVFLINNPGDVERASEGLEFDTREAQAQAPDGPGELVTQYFADTQDPEAMTQADGTKTPRDRADLAAALIIDRDSGSWEQRLREEASKAGATYDPSDLQGIIRNFSYADNAGVDPQTFIDNAIDIYRRRGQSGGGPTPPPTAPPPPGSTGAGSVPPPTAPPPGQLAGAANPYQAMTGAAGDTQAGGPRSLMGPWTGTAPTSPTVAPYAWTPYEAPTPYTAATPYQPGAYEAPTYTPAQPFVPPTAAQAAAEPGYQFALQQGQQALERSGAARGVTNTGGTLKNILDYGQQAGAQQYGNVYNRAASTFGMNEAARQAAFGLNAPQQFQGWAATEAGRLGAYQMTEADRAGTYAQNEANRRASAQLNLMGGQQAWQTEAGRQQRDYANRYQQWGDQYNQWRQQGQDRFNEQWLLANA